ncbi:MAG: oligosaccharide flippase family protein [Bacteroidetes bacterium]|nr:oligosaccharide flippase family protein [Bacteroidota bacterium]
MNARNRHHWARSGFVSQLLALLTGSALSQVVLLVGYFVLASWYSPHDLGQLRVFTAIALTAALLINGGYDTAIMLPKREDEALSLLALCGRIALLVLLLSTPLAFVFQGDMAHWMQTPVLGTWGVWLPFSVVAEGFGAALHQYLVRGRQYRQISIVLLAHAVVFIGIGLLGSMIDRSPALLIQAFLVAQALRFTLYMVLARKMWVKAGLRLAWRVGVIGRKYNQYPTYHLGSRLANHASRELVAPVLSVLYGSAAAGIYGMAIQILYLPMRFINQAMPQVFYQRVAKARTLSQAMVRGQTLQAIFIMLLLNGIPTLLLALAGPWLFVQLLGQAWQGAGGVVRWLAAFAVVSGIVSPITSLVNIRSRLKAFFGFNVLLLFSRLGAIGLGFWFMGFWTSVALYGVVALVGAIILGLWMLRLASIWGSSANGTENGANG